MLKWAMSKIQKIKELASQNKGLNDKAVQYLLSYLESLEQENEHLWQNYKIGNLSGEGLRHAGAASKIKTAREKEDQA